MTTAGGIPKAKEPQRGERHEAEHVASLIQIFLLGRELIVIKLHQLLERQKSHIFLGYGQMNLAVNCTLVDRIAVGLHLAKERLQKPELLGDCAILVIVFDIPILEFKLLALTLEHFSNMEIIGYHVLGQRGQATA